MKKMLATILLFAAAMAALTSAAEVGPRALEGIARDHLTGDPVAAANVFVFRLGGDAAQFRTVTDVDGRFRIEGVETGRWYRIDVRAFGYHPVREGIEVLSAPGDVEVLVALHPDSGPQSSQPCVRLGSQTATSGGARLLGGKELVAFELRGEPREELERDDADATAVVRPQVPIEASADREVAGGVSTQLPQSFSGKAVSPRRVALQGNSSWALSEAEAFAALESGSADELWILERSSASRPVNPDDPGTGCLVVIREDEEIPVPLEHTDVHARIDGYIASVDVRQRFHNPFDETIEAEYVFPLPHDAAVNDFLMIIGERRIRGIIREKEEAREIYERARQMGHAASLLEQERPNIFKQRVANIEPGHKIEIELHYFNALPYRDGEFEFAFPLVVGPRFNPPGSQDPIEALPRGVQPAGTGVNYLAPGERSGHDVDITVELDAGLRIQDLESLNHATSVVKKGRERALVRLSPNDTIPNKDFVLRYRVAGDEVNSEILVHREGEDGFFTMMLVPPASLENLRRAPVEFVFVLDCSGSMNGWPMEKSKSAMRRALSQLQTGDSFQIIRFSEHASALGPVPVEATPENIRRGLDYVDGLHGGGGTMMIEGIKAALDFPHQPGRERIVSFMTDGYIGNEAEIFGAVAERLGKTRIFSFGIGQSVNRHLIEGMARMGRGAVAYIGLNDDLDAVDQFYQAVRHPALTDVTIDWGEMQVAQVFPQKAHDLFVGRPVLMHGRYTGSGDAVVRVRGTAGGQTVEMQIDVDLDGGEARKALPLIWARSELQHISDQLARSADESLERRGLDLALDYNLVSNWTSFVAVDASEVVDQPGTRTETVPVPVPEGVNYDTTVGEQGR